MVEVFTVPDRVLTCRLGEDLTLPHESVCGRNVDDYAVFLKEIMDTNCKCLSEFNYETRYAITYAPLLQYY